MKCTLPSCQVEARPDEKTCYRHRHLEISPFGTAWIAPASEEKSTPVAQDALCERCGDEIGTLGEEEAGTVFGDGPACFPCLMWSIGVHAERQARSGDAGEEFAVRKVYPERCWGDCWEIVAASEEPCSVEPDCGLRCVHVHTSPTCCGFCAQTKERIEKALDEEGWTKADPNDALRRIADAIELELTLTRSGARDPVSALELLQELVKEVSR